MTTRRPAPTRVCVLAAALLVHGCGTQGVPSDAGVGSDGSGAGDAAGSTDAQPGADAAATDAAADAGPPGALLTEVCGAIAIGFCDAIFACCDAFVTDGYGANTAECNDVILAQCFSFWADVQTAADAGRLTLDPAQLAACSAALQATAVACDADILGLLQQACYPTVAGLVSSGGACAGSARGFEWAECNEGTCVMGQCEPWLGPGDDCSSGGACDVYELRCIDDGLTSTCQAPRALGAPCAADSDCASWNCGSSCEPIVGADVCIDL